MLTLVPVVKSAFNFIVKAKEILPVRPNSKLNWAKILPVVEFADYYYCHQGLIQRSLFFLTEELTSQQQRPSSSPTGLKTWDGDL